MKIGIIADDLTSAADGAAPFGRAGHGVTVCFASDDILTMPFDTEVVSLDLDSRARGANEAAALAARAGHLLRKAPVLYKTMDSTIRGHIAVEIASTLKASGRRVALVAPAFPAAGRTTIGGVQHVGGVAIGRTTFANDLSLAAREGRIAALFKGATLGPVIELTGPDARDARRIHTALAEAQVVIVDASSESDLDHLVDSAKGSDRVLWVGSPGIAQALARAYPGPRRTLPGDVPNAAKPLILVGSLHPSSRAQVATLAVVRQARIIEIDPTCISTHREDAEIARACTQCLDLHDKAVPVVISSAASPITGAAGPTAVLLARVAQHLRAKGAIDGLIATGGDTAIAVARSFGATGLRLWRDLEPGVPFGTLLGSDPMPIITKAGGFGDSETLIRLWDAMRDPALSSNLESLRT
jgi:uncharacterized protein YgbK (DUF1537 family)